MQELIHHLALEKKVLGVGTFLDFIIMDQTDVVPSFDGVKAHSS